MQRGLTGEQYEQSWHTVDRKKLYTDDQIKKLLKSPIYEGSYKKAYTNLNVDQSLAWDKYRMFLRLKYKSNETNKIREEYNDTKQANRTNDANYCLNFSKIVRTHFGPFEHLIKNLDSNPFKADYLAPNPYFVDVSAITVNHETLKNFLHIRVFMNRSVSDEKKKLHTENERFDHAKGRIKAIFISVKDQVIGFILMKYDYDS